MCVQSTRQLTASQVSVTFLYYSGSREVATVGDSVEWSIQESTEFDAVVAIQGPSDLDAGRPVPRDRIAMATICHQDKHELIKSPDAAIVLHILLEHCEAPVTFLPLMKQIRPEHFNGYTDRIESCPQELESVRGDLNLVFRKMQIPLLVKGIRKRGIMLIRTSQAISKPRLSRSKKKRKEPQRKNTADRQTHRRDPAS